MKNLDDLVGKTIASAVRMKFPAVDDEPYIRLQFTDGTECVMVAWYGGFTGNSADEYPACIGIAGKVPEGLVEVR